MEKNLKHENIKNLNTAILSVNTRKHIKRRSMHANIKRHIRKVIKNMHVNIRGHIRKVIKNMHANIRDALDVIV